MASSTVFEISRLDLQESQDIASPSITNLKHLTSYNWIEAPKSTPTIAVPGSPALWSPPAAPRRLKKDSGLIYISQNAARHPESPLEPLFRALYTTLPSFDITPTDVVTDRNNIRKLLSFIDPYSGRNGLEPFTVNVEVTKNTAIFSRDVTKCVEYIGSTEFRGFGHEFEKAYTTGQIDGSTGHHRVISFCFSDLNFIVRHETDGYVDEAKGHHSAETLSNMLGGLSLSASNPSSDVLPSHPESKLRIKKQGQAVPMASTLEIKTRISHKPLDLQEVMPQLWISQTPRLVRAYHTQGIFTTPLVQDVRAEIQDWEQRKQNDLRKLAVLIRKIISLAKQCGGTAVLKSDGDTDRLLIYKVDRKTMLPQDLYSKWDEVHDQGADVDEETAQAKGERMSSVSGIVLENRGRTVITDGTQMTSSPDGVKTTIRIGDVNYNVDLSKFPYLASFVQRQKIAHPEATEFIHDPIELFAVALEGVESGYRQCLQSLPTNVSQYRILFETYKFLQVDVLGGLSLDEVVANVEVGIGKANYGDSEDQTPLSSDKPLADDSAFQLLCLILHAQPGADDKDHVKIFDAVMFVVSHPGTFEYRTKRVVRLAYDETFTPTLKQRAKLDQWENIEAADSGPEVPTEQESSSLSHS